MSETQRKISKRYEANCEIINKLLAMATKYPDLRFHQLLQNCRVNLADTIHNMHSDTLRMIDLWHEESVDTLERVRDSYDQMINQDYENKREQERASTTGSGGPATE